MGNWKTFILTCLGVGLAAGAGFYLYRKLTSTDGNDEITENSDTQSATCTQEVSKDDPIKEDLGDVPKDDTTTVISNETQTEVPRVKEDTSSLQNGVDKQQKDATGNLTERQKIAERTYQTQRKSTFGGLKKGFLL